MTPPPRQGLRDALWLGVALLGLLAWEVSGGDQALSAWAGGHEAFPLRHPGTWASVLHEAGRVLCALLLGALIVDAAWPAPPWRGPGAARGVAQRRVTAAATVGVLVAVPALKRVSRTSCPWDVVDYGGTVPWVSHWALSVADGGPGHCFPSGHAVAAFAFLVPALAWRRQHPGRARVALAAVLAVGALFGAVQVLRGAHYLSHVLWSAWLCAAMAVAVDAARRLQAGFS
ncbi:MAG: phosphatase PAP2 family protein [Burkholderiaceae bacterium]|nr:phosphatase PAP2 family protein [Burkholderiaceae bacterium]MCZ8174657.1 phosphatase PAP2 family protein [Burkholderiaceae bacterium]